jgi:formylglycine-generating enzyme
MGSPWCEWGRAKYSANPVQVTLTHPFRIQQLELSQRQWVALGLPNPSGVMADGTGDCIGDDCPVGNMTWTEALAFANQLSVRDGLPECYQLGGCQGDLGKKMTCRDVRSVYGSQYDCPGYRLPTGAEWEYAGRAGTKTSVYTGDVVEHAPEFVCFDDPLLSPIAWYCANAGPYTHPGGQKLPNAWGLYDMIGNAGEFVASLTVPGYGDGPYVDYGSELNLAGMPDAAQRGVQARGGSWNGWPNVLSVSRVLGCPPWGGGPGAGFRLAQTILPKRGSGP